MISTSVKFRVSGSNYEDIIAKSKRYLADFLELPYDTIETKVNIEIQVSDQTELVDFDEDEYSATIIAQVRNV